MKAESRQIRQKLAARLKFVVFDPLRESLPLLFSANVDIYWKNYETGKGRTDELSHQQKSCVWNKE